MGPITASATLARRIDGVEAVLVSTMADAARADGEPEVVTWSIGGGTVALAGSGSPFNKAIAVGFDGPPDPEALAAIEAVHDARGCPLQVELSTLASPEAASALTGRGYRLVGFENVLARRLDDAAAPPPGAIAVQEAALEERDLWIETLTDAFSQPDVFDGPPSHETFAREALVTNFRRFCASPGVLALIARIDGGVAGAASLFVESGVALLCGAATLPAFRRQGVQSTLLRTRLAAARACGCDLAVVTTQPGSPSQANVQRAGFQLIYSRAVLVREPSPG
ncbi:MAG: GNAT family N-acetyltransferase [Vicinamibacterales bacterium]